MNSSSKSSKAPGFNILNFLRNQLFILALFCGFSIPTSVFATTFDPGFFDIYQVPVEIDYDHGLFGGSDFQNEVKSSTGYVFQKKQFVLIYSEIDFLVPFLPKTYSLKNSEDTAILLADEDRFYGFPLGSMVDHTGRYHEKYPNANTYGAEGYFVTRNNDGTFTAELDPDALNTPLVSWNVYSSYFIDFAFNERVLFKYKKIEADLDNDGINEFILQSTQPGFSTLVLGVDANGEVNRSAILQSSIGGVASYTGNTDIVIKDISGDGVSEIIFNIDGQTPVAFEYGSDGSLTEYTLQIPIGIEHHAKSYTPGTIAGNFDVSPTGMPNYSVSID
ncbi:MAG: hypothetical protein JKY67_17495, partial [Pseudomonadales bacterium]|nr:hypothetical protein [Pseudomonadales bacterium]